MNVAVPTMGIAFSGNRIAYSSSAPGENFESGLVISFPSLEMELDLLGLISRPWATRG